MKRTGPTNPLMRETIARLRQQNAKMWSRVARELQRPARARRQVNLSKIERFAKPGETILVPGKVLSAGVLSKAVSVAAWSFSSAAAEKIKAAGGRVLSIEQLIKTNPKGTGVRIIG